jgi:hypothetical protein
MPRTALTSTENTLENAALFQDIRVVRVSRTLLYVFLCCVRGVQRIANLPYGFSC